MGYAIVNISIKLLNNLAKDNRVHDINRANITKSAIPNI